MHACLCTHKVVPHAASTLLDQALKERYGAAYMIDLRFDAPEWLAGAADDGIVAQDAASGALAATAPATFAATTSDATPEEQAALQQAAVAQLAIALPGLTLVEMGWGTAKCALPMGIEDHSSIDGDNKGGWVHTGGWLDLGKRLATAGWGERKRLGVWA
jgi:hypothetical protein